MAGLLDRSVPADVPEHEFLDRYGPQYSMLEAGKPVLAPDGNNPAKIESACAGLLSGLEEVIEARQLALKGSGVACKRTRTQE